MGKPDWLVAREAQNEMERRLKHCIRCKHRGPVVGETNYIDKNLKRQPVYQCAIHPTVKFHLFTLACTDYERMRPM